MWTFMTVIVALTMAEAAQADATVESQHVLLRMNPATHDAIVECSMKVSGIGTLRFHVNNAVQGMRLESDADTTMQLVKTEHDNEPHIVVVTRRSAKPEHIRFSYEAIFEQDVAAGEVAGQIHNKSVSAHIGDDGIFLSDGSAWHPLWVDEQGHARLTPISIDVVAMDGWAVVCSGNPVAHLRSISDPVWNWATPRPVPGMAVVGNRHVIVGESHATEHGPVEVLMHVDPSHEQLAPMFIEAAKEYLDLYVPRLGAFPYRRFSIVENFFSSGFAYPGFTVLGPQVVGMAPRSLAPGYLDHEMVHNWWGNGVYVDPNDGNWCEALTSYCANYFRRIADDGEDAGRAYRRGMLMRLSTDSESMDNGPLGTFGHDPGLNRFVGYDKGAFVFSMLEGGGPHKPVTDGRAAMFRALRRFSTDNLGQYAGWAGLQEAFESEFNADINGFIEYWIREDARPRTGIKRAGSAVTLQKSALGPDADFVEFTRGEEDGRRWLEVDPHFRFYRVLPLGHLVPTIAGTQGPGDVEVQTYETRDEVSAFLPRLDALDEGENLMLIGSSVIEQHTGLIGKTGDPITAGEGWFTVAGVKYDHPDQSVLHTMAHPDRPGRFITVFLSNGDSGWSRLRLITFYSRDTTVIWQDGRVIERRVFEPDRRFWGTER